MKKILAMLYEIRTLAQLKRNWYQYIGLEAASVSEHSLRVIWLALMISRLEKKGDEEKIIKIAMVHDIGEARCGDTHFLNKFYSKKDESKAVKDILKGTPLEKDFGALYEDYKERGSLEAKIVKDADNLDVDMELFELSERGSAFAKSWDHMRKKICNKLLYTESARKLFKQIKMEKPYHWINKYITKEIDRRKK